MTDMLPEKWMKGVAITTTCLAVLTAVVSARSTTCAAKIQNLTALESSKWNYYQSKSIKFNLAETQEQDFSIQVLASQNGTHKDALTTALATLQSEIKRYGQEKEQIRVEAEDVGRQKLYVQEQGNQFTISVVFFQIAIMLSSVSALVKRKELWYFGLVFGALAMVFFANGFFLFYHLPVTF